MYKELSINNFRALKEIDITGIGNINIITGANGTGKSTILESIFLNAGANNTSLTISLNGLRGDDEINTKNDSVFHSLFHDLDSSEVISIKSHYKMPNNILVSRDLDIRARISQRQSAGETDVGTFVSGLDYRFETKKVKAKKSKRMKGSIWFNESENTKPIEHTKSDQSAVLSCRYISPMVHTMRKISEGISTVIKAKKIDEVINLLHIIDPRISKVTTISENGRNEVYIDIGLDTLMPAAYMGGGFIRILYLAIAMHTDKILLVDEIENGLHYTTQKPLLDFMFRAARDLKTQIFMTTHSSELLDNFTEVMRDYESLDISAYRCHRTDKGNSVTKYSEDELGLREQLDIEIR